MQTTPTSSSARTRKARGKTVTDSEPGKTVAKRAATTAAAPPEVAKPAAAKPRSRKSPATATATASATVIAHSEAELRKMIAEAAYYLAEHRNFTTGDELHDWLTAEQQIRRQYQHA